MIRNSPIPSKIRLLPRILALAVMGLLLTHCDKKSLSPTGSSVSPTFSSLYDNVFSKNCVQCHSPGGSGPTAGVQIDFSSKSQGYSTLRTATVAGDSGVLNGNCTTVSIISAGNPNSSYLLATLSTDYNHSDFGKTGCLPYSPSTHGATVSSSELSAMVQWINNGAAND
jgi:hypothetical protein